MEEGNSLYVGINNLGLPTAVVLRHMERTCLPDEESQRPAEITERDG